MFGAFALRHRTIFGVLVLFVTTVVFLQYYECNRKINQEQIAILQTLASQVAEIKGENVTSVWADVRQKYQVRSYTDLKNKHFEEILSDFARQLQK